MERSEWSFKRSCKRSGTLESKLNNALEQIVENAVARLSKIFEKLLNLAKSCYTLSTVDLASTCKIVLLDLAKI